MPNMVKVGFVQTNPVFGDIQNNFVRVSQLIGQKSVDLLILPELFATGYQFLDAKEARDLAEPIPGGYTTQALITLAGNLNAAIIGGIAEREKDAVYNSAVLVGPRGYIGKYRKAHLFDSEKNIFQPGMLPLPVFDVGPARVGVMICFDWRFPETARTLALKGADIIAHPANLVLPHCPQAMITRCLENRVFAVTADRVGIEDRIPGQSLKYLGQSQVVDPDGNVLYRASIDREEVKVLEIDIDKSRNKAINKQNDLFRDRREDLYRIK